MLIIGMCIGSFLMIFRIWQFDNFPDLTAYVLGGIFGLLWGGVLGLAISHIYALNYGGSIMIPNDFWSGVIISLLLIAFLILRVVHTFRRDLKNLDKDYE